MEEFSTYLSSKGYHPKTVQRYKPCLQRFLDWLEKYGYEAETLVYADFINLSNYLQERGFTAVQTNLVLIVCRHYYHSKGLDYPGEGLVVRGSVQEVPQDIISREKLDRLYQGHPTGSPRAKRNKAITGLLVYQGLTVAELDNLKLSNFDLENGLLKLKTVGRIKGRVLKLEAVQVLQLQTYLLQTRSELLGILKDQNRCGRKSQTQTDIKEGQMFFALNGCNSLKKSLPSLIENLKQIEPSIKSVQQIRRSVIVDWLGKHDIRKVQHMAGHGSITATQKYQSAQLEELRAAVGKYHPLK
jgi:integrase/recombinase XerD